MTTKVKYLIPILEARLEELKKLYEETLEEFKKDPEKDIRIDEGSRLL